MSTISKEDFAGLLNRKASESYDNATLADSMREYSFTLERVDEEITFTTEGFAISGDRQTRIGKFLARTSFFTNPVTRAYLIPLLQDIRSTPVTVADLESAARFLGLKDSYRQQRVKDWASVIVPAVKSARREFLFVKGSALIDYMEADTRRGGTCPHSCMTGSYESFNRDTLHIYANNPDRVRLLIARGHWGDSRAFIWKTDDGKILVDRVYPSDQRSAGYLAIKQLAQRKGWMFRSRVSYPEPGYSPLPNGAYKAVTLKLGGTLSETRMPYMDTFYHLKEGEEESTIITLDCHSDYDEGYTFLETGGIHDLYESRVRRCNCCGTRVRYDVCQDDSDYCSGCGTYDARSGYSYREVVFDRDGLAIPAVFAGRGRGGDGDWLDQRVSAYITQRGLWARPSEIAHCHVSQRADFADLMTTSDSGIVYSEKACTYFGYDIPATTTETEATDENQ